MSPVSLSKRENNGAFEQAMALDSKEALRFNVSNARDMS